MCHCQIVFISIIYFYKIPLICSVKSHWFVLILLFFFFLNHPYVLFLLYLFMHTPYLSVILVSLFSFFYQRRYDNASFQDVQFDIPIMYMFPLAWQNNVSYVMMSGQPAGQLPSLNIYFGHCGHVKYSVCLVTIIFSEVKGKPKWRNTTDTVD